MNTNTLVGASMVILLALGVGIGWGFRTTVSPNLVSTNTETTSTTTAGVTPYSLAIPETMGNLWNSTVGMQPKYFVEGSNGFQSSANITLPANRLIQLTIVSYDTPTANSTASEALVSGTVGGVVYLINGTLASATTPSMDSSMGWGQNVTSVPVGSLAHTFTIQQLGINIPVVGGSTVIAYLYFDKPGVYTWICLTPCGYGKDGLSGAMSTSGWMTGTLTVK
ncbi:MAG: hypothetical protein OK438_06135 [Thaumarchaeota archaeon]|nr:hypothetical protein [Nitrososphaerota archaeon]